jgi:hypothetical protein
MEGPRPKLRRVGGERGGRRSQHSLHLFQMQRQQSFDCCQAETEMISDREAARSASVPGGSEALLTTRFILAVEKH